jgi:hypothetical protein
MIKHRNGAGDVIAWIDTTGTCENRHCKRAIRDGRPVHIIPAPTDPRAANFTLAMTQHHYATVDEAKAALDDQWSEAEVAMTADERDDAYARGVPVKIAKGVRRP